jgi:hypothetical protein
MLFGLVPPLFCACVRVCVLVGLSPPPSPSHHLHHSHPHLLVTASSEDFFQYWDFSSGVLARAGVCRSALPVVRADFLPCSDVHGVITLHKSSKGTGLFIRRVLDGLLSSGAGASPGHGLGDDADAAGFPVPLAEFVGNAAPVTVRCRLHLASFSFARAMCLCCALCALTSSCCLVVFSLGASHTVVLRLDGAL